jgi:replicative DNA helicase
VVTELRPGRQTGTPMPGTGKITTMRDVLSAATDDTARPTGGFSAPLRTGLGLLDRVLDGGFRRHDLILLGGSPGVGKTVAALQMARNVARDGQRVVYVSYEHDELTMLGRLLALELGELATPGNAPDVDRLRQVVVDATAGFRSLQEVVHTEPLVQQAVQELHRYADDLQLVRASSATTDVAACEEFVRPQSGRQQTRLLVVDYLQKVAVHPEPATEAEKVTRSAEALKDLALREGIAVLAVVAADWEGVRAARLRIHHLRGSSALAYECDVAVIMNDKYDAVSRVHITYDAVKAERFRHQVIFSVEKNRGGPAMVDIEFDKDFLHYRFVPDGRYLAERLADDRLAIEG